MVGYTKVCVTSKMESTPDARTGPAFPERGARRIRGASFDVSEDNFKAILNFKHAYYSCAAREFCPDTGKPHIQFYVACKNSVRLSTLRAAIKDAAFFPCERSNEENKLYVLKMRQSDIDEHGANWEGNHCSFQERGSYPTPVEISQSMSQLLHIIRVQQHSDERDILIEQVQEYTACLHDEIEAMADHYEQIDDFEDDNMSDETYM